MPRLSLFVVCEKLLFDQDSRTASLIGVMEKLRVEIPADFEGSMESAIIPMQAIVFVLWKRDATDSAEEYQHVVRVYDPMGEVANSSGIIDFVIPKDSDGVKHGVKMETFPVGHEGFYSIRIAVREKGASNWTECGNYPLLVKHQRLASATAEPTPSVPLPPSSQLPSASSGKAKQLAPAHPSPRRASPKPQQQGSSRRQPRR